MVARLGVGNMTEWLKKDDVMKIMDNLLVNKDIVKAFFKMEALPSYAQWEVRMEKIEG